MFDKNYYQEKRIKILQRFTQAKDRALQNIFNVMSELEREQKTFKEDLAEVERVIKQDDSDRTAADITKAATAPQKESSEEATPGSKVPA